MSDDDIVQAIFELRLKMNGLMDWAKNAGRSDLGSLRALEEKAHVIHYSTLQSNIHAERMSIGNQKALAKAFDFWGGLARVARSRCAGDKSRA